MRHTYPKSLMASRDVKELSESKSGMDFFHLVIILSWILHVTRFRPVPNPSGVEVFSTSRPEKEKRLVVRWAYFSSTLCRRQVAVKVE